MLNYTRIPSIRREEHRGHDPIFQAMPSLM